MQAVFWDITEETKSITVQGVEWGMQSAGMGFSPQLQQVLKPPRTSLDQRTVKH